MSLAIVALSGGMDSCVTAAIAKRDGFELCLLHASYGQLTEARERLAFQQIADYYEVTPGRRLVVPMQALKIIGGSSLTDATMQMEHGNLDRAEVPSTYVPFRNAHLLATCVSWAEAIGATDIFVGFVEADSSGYPDCSAEFLKAFEAAANSGTKLSTSIKIHAPLIDKTKAEIVKIGMSIDAPLHLTWSCYKSEARACGVCDSCLLRLRGFSQAGFSDPIDYVQNEKKGGA
ncbi:MAG: 7-cyano-7-deazaguanine synthase QueC [Holophagales bacterium]|jgi:7-cyano-7-deazaguanine synthase|nr:7-cyano-7-deazaguanine synthase QueC [Holophagales bacterium]